MKTFGQLTEAQKAAAITLCTTNLLHDICEGTIAFADDKNHDDLQARIDAAIKKAEDMQTPWFAHEYVMDTCANEIEGMARCEAEDALYNTERERIITL